MFANGRTVMAGSARALHWVLVLQRQQSRHVNDVVLARKRHGAAAVHQAELDAPKSA
jgi:hypothetical protein